MSSRKFSTAWRSSGLTGRGRNGEQIDVVAGYIQFLKQQLEELEKASKPKP
jgi:hypothetical protein